jgi:hypothetical protein
VRSPVAASAKEAPAKQKADRSSARARPVPQPVFAPPVLIQRKCACGGSCPSCEEQKRDESRTLQTNLSVNTPGDALEQEAYDNQAVLRAVQSGVTPGAVGALSQHQTVVRSRGVSTRLQTKLTINIPGDQYEQEADSVAEQVMRITDPSPAMTAPVLKRKCACGGAGGGSGECSECSNRDQLQRYAAGPPSSPEAPAIVYEGLREPGMPLDESARAFFEARFGLDFSSVRVHKNARAAEAVGAVAYAVGEHVTFGTGQYAPDQESGRKLLAHELVHVIQQRPGRPNISHGRSLAMPAQQAPTEPKRQPAKVTATGTLRLARQQLTSPWRPPPEIIGRTAHAAVALLVELHGMYKSGTYQETVHHKYLEWILWLLKESFTDMNIINTFAPADRRLAYSHAADAIDQVRRLEGASRLGYPRLDDERTWTSAIGAMRMAEHDLEQIVDTRIKVFEVPSAQTPAGAPAAFDAYLQLGPADRESSRYFSYSTGSLQKALGALGPSNAAGKYADVVQDITRWVQVQETRKFSGKTDEQMAESHGKWMEAQAVANATGTAGGTPSTQQIAAAGQAIVATTAIPPGIPSKWNDPGFPRAKWNAAGERAIDAMVNYATTNYPSLGLKKEHFILAFEAMEGVSGTATAYHTRGPGGASRINIGYDFVKTVLMTDDIDKMLSTTPKPEYMIEVVFHEFLGHQEFEDVSYAMGIYDAAAKYRPSYTRPVVGRSKREDDERRDEQMSFGYHSTEIYAIMRGFDYKHPVALADRVPGVLVLQDPKDEIARYVGLMAKEWEPSVGASLMRGLYARFRIDPRLSTAAVGALADAIRLHFPSKAADILK